MNHEYRDVLNSILSSFQDDVFQYATGQVQLSLPLLTAEFLADLFARAQSIFSCESTLLALSSPCIVVGDIHGQILDLCRILQTYGLPPTQRYLFLGDIVDRGEFSIETLSIVYLLKIIWPDEVHLIRGNHEFHFLCSQGGFMQQICDCYTNYKLYSAATSSFAHIPLAALINSTILCVHGGIGPSVSSLDQIRSIPRPVADFGNDALDAVVWSDPSDATETFARSQTRGAGYIFGNKAFTAFLKRAKVSLVLRAHEVVSAGYAEHFDGTLITVFSASNYGGLIGNQGAVVEIAKDGSYTPRQFAPLPWLRRRYVWFRPMGSEQPRLKPRKAETGSPLAKLKQAGTPLPTASSSILQSKLRATTSMKTLPVLPELSLAMVPLKRDRLSRRSGSSKRSMSDMDIG
jgi:protein phosphatase